MAKSKKKKKVKFKVKNIIFLLVIFIIFMLIGYRIIMMPIANIYISGNKILTDNEIMEMVDIDNYPSFILANRYSMKKKLLSNSYIEGVEIKKKFGNIIEFDIMECSVVASKIDRKIILSNGNVVDNNYEVYDIPLLINDINDNDVYNLFVLKMRNLDKNILRQISEIEYSPVLVDKERFLFYMSDGNLVHVTLTKFERIEKYNKIKDKLEGKIGIIYLDSGNYVELKEA